jgi:hypothetical protein
MAKFEIRALSKSVILGAFNPKLIGVVGFMRRGRMKCRHKGVIWSMYIAPKFRGLNIENLFFFCGFWAPYIVSG